MLTKNKFIMLINDFTHHHDTTEGKRSGAGEHPWACVRKPSALCSGAVEAGRTVYLRISMHQPMRAPLSYQFSHHGVCVI